ncbi:hypothetical protein EX30DRAFT_393233 [Ascodesmis nigricans]|uniref:Something about silencing protein 4 domain-containing protein n=1 Tax=Ascodesmis nigricans TaxID=341454 RepID=A0A4S2N3K6_9PEZI|nr:hypothetical protein EX30DRAFT_393233 [Ascodesmis nigricans]
MSSFGTFLGAPSAASSSFSTITTATTPTDTTPPASDRQCEPSMSAPSPHRPFIRLVFKKHVSPPPPPSPLVATPDSIDGSTPRRRRRRREEVGGNSSSGEAAATSTKDVRCGAEQQDEVGRTGRKRRKDDGDGITAETYSTVPATTEVAPTESSSATSRSLRRKRSRLTTEDESDVAGDCTNETLLKPPPIGTTSGSHSASGSPTPSATTSNATSVKRKRKIPECIGGGKGDLLPTPELLRIPDTPPPPEAAERAHNQRSRIIAGGERDKVGGSREAGGGQETAKTEEKRVLRSQAPPSKRSEFEEWFELQEEPEFDYDAPIPVIWLKEDGKPTLLNSAPSSSKPPLAASPSEFKPPDKSTKLLSEEFPTFDWDAALAKHGRHPSKFKSDPLPDSLYTAAHLGDVRRESRVRNIERERLAFAAQNYEQTLTALRNPGWQKAINLSTATASQFSPKELEKRRAKLEDYMANFIAKQKRFTDAERKPKGGAARRSFSPYHARDRDQMAMYSGDEDAGDGQRRNKTRKLSLEAPGSIRKLLKEQGHHHHAQEPEFTSFYSSQVQRDQALRTGRRKSDRILTAFGQPLSTVIFEEQEYALPQYLLEEKQLGSHNTL